MPRKKSVLTQKQEVLANAVLDGKSVSQAGRDAGYSNAVSAHQAMRSGTIQEHVEAARSQLTDALQLNRVDIIEGIMDAVNIARMATDPGSMIRGYSEIAKMLGMYEPEKKVIELTDNQNRIRQKYETMSTVELLQLVEGRVIDGESTRVQ
jgi:hypothetical protein